MKLESSLVVEITLPFSIAWKSPQKYYNRTKELTLTFEQLNADWSIRASVEKRVVNVFNLVTSFCWFRHFRVYRHFCTNSRSRTHQRTHASSSVNRPVLSLTRIGFWLRTSSIQSLRQHEKRVLKNKHVTRFRQNFHICICALGISSAWFMSLFLRFQMLLRQHSRSEFRHHILLWEETAMFCITLTSVPDVLSFISLFFSYRKD